MSAEDRFGYAASGQFAPPAMPSPFEEPTPTHKTVVNAAEQYGLVTEATKQLPVDVSMTAEAANRQPPPAMEFEADRARRCLAWMDANAPHAGETREQYVARMEVGCRAYVPTYETTHPNLFGPPTPATLMDRCRSWTTANPQHAGETSGAWYDRMAAAIPECATILNRPGTVEPAPPQLPAVVPTTAMDTVRSIASNRYVQVGAVVAGGYLLYRLLRK